MAEVDAVQDLQSAKQTALASITELERVVRLIDEEFGFAQQLHEAWKPMAYDMQLRQRVTDSGIGNTFVTIGYALRRELMLALMRIWDKPGDSLRMLDVALKLERPGVVDELIRRQMRQHDDKWVDLQEWGDNTTRAYRQYESSDA